jgi:hypothetical protein
MGPFRWLATFWTPAVDYREYAPNEVEDIAWEATTIGSKRGFLLGIPAGALLAAVVLVVVGMTWLYAPSASPPAPKPAPPDPAAAQAARQELTALREENQALKAQLMEAKAAANPPPCPPQAAATDRPQAPAKAAAPEPPKQVTSRAPAPRKPSVPAPDERPARPIPSNCRQEGDCQ